MFSLLVPQQAFNVCWFSNLIQHLICFLPSKIVILILDLSPNTVRIQWFSFPMFKLSDWYLNLGGAIIYTWRQKCKTLAVIKGEVKGMPIQRESGSRVLRCAEHWYFDQQSWTQITADSQHRPSCAVYCGCCVGCVRVSVSARACRRCRSVSPQVGKQTQ